jgi:hypothetical protein
MLKTIIAFYYLFYGITKLIIGFSLMSLPLDYIKKIPILKIFIIIASDKTLAGHFYEYILMLFGVYTIIMGLSYLHILPVSIRHIIETKTFQYPVYIIFGLILIIFYSLVSYTNLPIEHSHKEDDLFHYKLIGIGGGISFLLIPIIIELFIIVIPGFRCLPYENKSMIILGGSIFIIIIIGFIWTIFDKYDLIIQSTKQGLRLTKKGYTPF